MKLPLWRLITGLAVLGMFVSVAFTSLALVRTVLA